jgi:hypothetical protein
MSEAKCETGWGDLSTRSLLDVKIPSPHPAARFTRVDPPLQGRVRKIASRVARTSECHHNDSGDQNPSCKFPLPCF